MDYAELFNFILFFGGISVLYLGLHWLDSRYNLQLVSWSNGEDVNPFEKTDNARKTENSESIDDLNQRIEVLEKVITDREYELNEKMNRL